MEVWSGGEKSVNCDAHIVMDRCCDGLLPGGRPVSKAVKYFMRSVLQRDWVPIGTSVVSQARHIPRGAHHGSELRGIVHNHRASSPLNVMSYESVYVMGLVAFLNDHESPALTAEIDISTAVTDMSLCPSNLASWQMKPKTWHPGTG
eukprot:1179954-Prorocentrum_minimum.AAC.4